MSTAETSASDWEATEAVWELPADDLDVPFKLPRRELEEAEMDITPMIDITFLLLIFFLVASRVDSNSEVKLPPAANGTAVATKSSVLLAMTQDGDSVQIYKADGAKKGTELSSSDPVDQEAEIVSYVEEGVADGKMSVILKAEKSVKHGEISRVAKAIGSVEGARLYVAIMEQSD